MPHLTFDNLSIFPFFTSHGCISSKRCPACGVNLVCDSSLAGTREGGTRYVYGPCCCGLFSCPECGHNWGLPLEKDWLDMNTLQNPMPNVPKVIAFDLFGTVFDLAGVQKDELRAYAAHIHQAEWSPLRLPESWERLPAFPDSAAGIAMLRRKFTVVTCSNAPLGLQVKLTKNAHVQFDGHIPLELNRVFKTDPRAYLTVCEVLGVVPADVLMVTANKTFGDIEAARALGMGAAFIRNSYWPETIIDLATLLGCEADSE